LSYHKIVRVLADILFPFNIFEQKNSIFRANPYQKVIQILGKTLEPFTDYGHVYAYGFGDAVSQDFDVFNLIPLDEDDVCGQNKSCNDFRQGCHFLIIIVLQYFIILEVK